MLPCSSDIDKQASECPVAKCGTACQHQNVCFKLFGEMTFQSPNDDVAAAKDPDERFFLRLIASETSPVELHALR